VDSSLVAVSGMSEDDHGSVGSTGDVVEEAGFDSVSLLPDGCWVTGRIGCGIGVSSCSRAGKSEGSSSMMVSACGCGSEGRSDDRLVWTARKANCGPKDGMEIC
jgi:hypothetical protein